MVWTGWGASIHEQYELIGPDRTTDDLRGVESHLQTVGLVCVRRSLEEISHVVSDGEQERTADVELLLNATAHMPALFPCPLADEITLSGGLYSGRTENPAPYRADFPILRLEAGRCCAFTDFMGWNNGKHRDISRNLDSHVDRFCFGHVYAKLDGGDGSHAPGSHAPRRGSSTGGAYVRVNFAQLQHDIVGTFILRGGLSQGWYLLCFYFDTSNRGRTAPSDVRVIGDALSLNDLWLFVGSGVGLSVWTAVQVVYNAVCSGSEPDCRRCYTVARYPNDFAAAICYSETEFAREVPP